MKLKQINSEQDVFTYLEGCMNDFDYGITTKRDTIGHLTELIIYLINLDRSNRGIKEKIKELFEDMKQSGEIEEINKELDVFQDNKLQILSEVIQKAHHKLLFKKYDAFMEYCDEIGVYPDCETLKKYEK